jgi:hypothetical protein
MIGAARVVGIGMKSASQTDAPEKVDPMPICYRLYVPSGRELRCLPIEYESLEEAKEAFEHISGIARWCLVAAHVPGRDGDDDAPRFVLRATGRDEGVTWKSLVQAPPEQAPTVDAAPVTLQDQHLTKLLTPQLGFFTAEEVARHVSARFRSADFRDGAQVAELREFLRCGLLAYMEPAAADELATKCSELPVLTAPPR